MILSLVNCTGEGDTGFPIGIKKDVEKLERVQNKAIKMIQGLKKYPGVRLKKSVH